MQDPQKNTSDTLSGGDRGIDCGTAYTNSASVRSLMSILDSMLPEAFSILIDASYCCHIILRLSLPCQNTTATFGIGNFEDLRTAPQPRVSQCANICKCSFFLQQRSHLQVKKLGEDGVGECHLIWMQASLNQKNSCKGGTKLSRLFFAANLEAHPIKKAKIWSGKWNEREYLQMFHGNDLPHLLHWPGFNDPHHRELPLPSGLISGRAHVPGAMTRAWQGQVSSSTLLLRLFGMFFIESK